MDLAIPYIIGLIVIGTTVYMAVGWWIFRPVDLAARKHGGPVRYSIADFLCLFVTAQIPLGIITWANPSEQLASTHLWTLLMCLAWVVPPLIWFTAARAISRAGILSGLPRVLFMGVVVPAAYYGLLTLSISLVVGIHQLTFGDGRWLRWSTSLVILFGCLLAVCGVLTRQILQANRANASTNDLSADFIPSDPGPNPA